MPQAPDVHELTLSTLANGAAEEMFGESLSTVLKNIDDVNTDHKTKRSIVIQFDFHVDEERRVGHVDVKCSTKLAGVKGVTANVYFGRHQGRHMVVEAPSQDTLFPNPDGKPRPVPEAAAGGERSAG